MNLPDGLLDGQWTAVAWVLFAIAAIAAVRSAPWRVLQESTRLNAFLALVVTLTLLWNLKAGVKPGLALHLLGATVFTLCYGWALAFVGLCLVLIGVSLNGAAGWQVYPVNALLMAGVGVAVSQGLHRLVDRLLPAQLFVFIFCKGFFASALTVIATGAMVCLVLGLAGAYPADYLRGEYLPYFVLLGFSEAWLSGMVATLLAVYRPDLLADFDDSRFLRKR
ncbi:MAG TPA: energy-coupling factor ABC transporter permease [Accumulibacter sp.]|nr:energy-coupling factor ABC transporter permease [Accumulibacter sp.]HMW18939.1 energy-coupling factor ABC transporter permease [Accumulibacter sp.]HMX21808.1 energy-coupling factor ABC transporter permease [Accumulibacter sp.]HMY07018.1 energy-coupling factor ABC transporter permease [Accumulibacter sp.]HNC16820.1 energy-coupling factor ABC transporter permease [Accumulibacter sp.]